MQEYAQQCKEKEAKPVASDEIADVEKVEEKEKNDASTTSNAKMQKSRKLISTCTNVEPWLLERFPLDAGDVVIVHVIHKTNMLPHFQIRLCSNASHDGKFPGMILDCFRFVGSEMSLLC